MYLSTRNMKISNIHNNIIRGAINLDLIISTISPFNKRDERSSDQSPLCEINARVIFNFRLSGQVI